MVLIQTQKKCENTTEDVLDWIFYMHPSLRVQRVNDQQEITAIEYRIADGNEVLKIETDDMLIDTSEMTSFWYRRGKFSLVKMMNSSTYGRLGSSATSRLNSDCQIIMDAINQFLQEGFRGINKCQDDRDANKIINLKLAKKVGFKIPATLITTSKSVLFGFITQHKQVISKVINYGFLKIQLNESEYIGIQSTSQLLTEKDFEDISNKLPDGVFLPSLFQEYIPKLFEIRVFYLDGDIYPMAIFSQENEKTKIDFRNYDYERPNRCVPYLLPERVRDNIVSFMKAADINCGSLDIIYSTSKDYVFLEVNPIGQFQWLDHNCNFLLARKIAHHLVKTNWHES